MTALGTRPTTDVHRAFWRELLLAGGSTALPRWAPAPVPGTAEVEVPLSDATLVALRRLADRLAVPLGSVLLAGHGRVLAALTGEPDVVTGYVAGDGGAPLPCRLRVDVGSWRELVRAAASTEAGLLAHRHADLSALRRELGTSGPSSEALFDPTGVGGELPGGAVLAVVPVHRGERLALRLSYRTDVLDAEAAARIGGYHRAALDELATDPDAGPMAAVLLSTEELVSQLDGLAGPHRELPDRRVHELIEEQARRHPDDVAAVHGAERITYRELDGRANQVARALLARGLQPEDVVAVVTERDLDWLTAVLAVFKAGGAYLPVEPHFPADRIARTLSRAECRLVLTEPGSTASLDAALTGLAGVQALTVGGAAAEGHPATSSGVQVGPDQLAYLYFTSGSTGEPKGAMCEHAGMLNHLLAKIDDLGVVEGGVVAQVAPQCFDISLWQLVSALVVGGRTVIVPQEVVLDAERFVDRLVDEHVTVVQVVPSYLEVVLTYLEAHPRALPDLRCVSVTGEALKKELVQRWFAAQPDIALVNAYGLTETSDDTNHEVMHEVPHGDRVPLGRPIANVEVRVVDEHLVPVPLGAPGEIVFSGVCVGRGYVNDPERTAAAFVPDPYRPGRRLYRSGDSGRWLPDGELEFLGRRDSQVKISGFRIEIGEIENTLLRVPGVRDGAVVVAEGPDRSRHLVAFWTGPDPIPDDVLRDSLAGALPVYMVPRAFHRRESLPLTPNGKIDTKALTALAGELLTGSQEHDAPTTPTERRLAGIWSTVLGVPADQIGRRDSFAALGGTSLSAVKLLVALGRAVSLKELQAAPDLAALAALLDGRAGSSPVPTPRTPEGSAR
ncbi:amino acid adenylation domain-containing protein [Geodermatophilus siccatus]|uniref:Amino acid adenylation domain-containing protein n=1 Tax=Geodermatophilus siccatus TaxID=1137991 RepID=A0A1G9SFV4_9ACTN|nr:amino acid adenylation domain-containing protein [Geodermatophilus siccatus]SDM34353.1 amino acid adenylation domain-containing protein [Geodermatophilus siccatus]